MRVELQEEAFQLRNSVFRVCMHVCMRVCMRVYIRVYMCAPASRPGGGGGVGWQGSYRWSRGSRLTPGVPLEASRGRAWWAAGHYPELSVHGGIPG